MTTVFDPLRLGDYTLANRIVMAPLTRGRAEAGAMPCALMAEYYAARSDAGLIITEATAISLEGYGWNNAPGIWNDAQVEGWQLITQAVHARGGKIFLQLWHMGRVSHPDFLNGKLPVAPSAIAAQGMSNTPEGKKPFVIPHALKIDEIRATVADYAAAAKRAMDAGFDGVEIHGANGYLIDQFIRDVSNKREDEYGGSIDNRLRFLTDVVGAVVNVIGAGKVGVRLSPQNPFNDMRDRDPIATFSRAAVLLNSFHLAYLHTLEIVPGRPLTAEGERVTPYMRKLYQGVLITNGGYDLDLANAALGAGEAEAIAFGVPFIANADLVARFKNRLSWNAPDVATFYTQGIKGYTDYPFAEK